jgi:hypothetical protein
MGDLDTAKKASSGDDDGSFNWGDFDSSFPDQPPMDDGAPYDAGGPVATHKRAFVTTGLFPPNFGDVDGGNAKCNAAAAAANLGGTWAAWLSTSTSKAVDQLSFAGPYTLVDDKTVVAPSKDALSGALSAPINVMEDGKPAPTGTTAYAWTGTRAGGAAGETCENWTSPSPVKLGTAGNVHDTGATWTDNGGQPLISTAGWQCSFTARLYCIER